MTDVAALIADLTARGETVAVAESLTGGALAALLTAPPGASAVIRGGVVVYATDTKAVLAGVSQTLLDEVGPVDPEVARQLAEGIRHRLGTTFGIGVTGVAGPDQQDGHPVGEVHVAVAGPLETWVRSLDLAASGGREAIRAGAVQAGLGLLAEVLGEQIA